MDIPGYQIHNEIYRSANSQVYRGTREADGCAVIFKRLREDYPAPEKLSQYRQEYAIIRKLDIDGVIKAYALEKHGNTPVLIVEDIGGESLEQLFKQETNLSGLQDLTGFLAFAARLAEIIGHVHAAGVIHKDITPNNIVWNPATGALRLIDFGIATEIPREMPALKSPERLEGTPAYLSPEQSGRMNRSVDYRSDFYSLGAVFYYLLCERPPFVAEDIPGLIHAHLAKQAVPPHEIRPAVPKAVSAIVMKLLAKEAEQRYQSAWGLQADLDTCRRGQSGLETFVPGQADFSEIPQPPQRLYGREQEVSRLLEAFVRVRAGRSEMLLVAGYSGVGETALVHEIYKPITEYSRLKHKNLNIFI